MIDLFAKVENKNRAIWLVAILMIIYNIIRLLAIIGPPYLIAQITNIEGGISFAEYKVAILTYINEVSENFQMPKNVIKLSLLYSGLVSIAYIFFSLYLGMRKNFAKYIVICLVTLEIIIATVICVRQSILPSIDTILFAIFLLLFLFSPNLNKAYS